MADDDDAQKTEDPTPKKLEEARKRGEVPMSREVNTWFMLLIGTMVVVMFVPGMMRDMSQFLQMFIEQSWQVHTDEALVYVLQRVFLQIAGFVGLIMIVLFFAGMIGPFAQIGPLVSYESITPKLNKVSPVQGFKRIFSSKSLFEFVKGLLKVVLVSVVVYYAIKPYFGGIEHVIDLPMAAVLDEMMTIFIRMMIAILVLLVVLAGMDLLYQRYTHYQKMRMSKQEIKDEYRNAEGDPHVKGKIRMLRMERAQNRMMQSVPQSTVVITNPTHFAIALKYDPDKMDAPVCVAKGADFVALKIREIAKDAGVIIVENPPLARTLFKVLDIDDVVPPEHYKAVAEVISYVFRLTKRL